MPNTHDIDIFICLKVNCIPTTIGVWEETSARETCKKIHENGQVCGSKLVPSCPMCGEPMHELGTFRGELLV